MLTKLCNNVSFDLFTTSPVKIDCSYNVLRTSIGAIVPAFIKFFSLKKSFTSAKVFCFSKACSSLIRFLVCLFLIKIPTVFPFFPKLYLIVLVLTFTSCFNDFLCS